MSCGTTDPRCIRVFGDHADVLVRSCSATRASVTPPSDAPASEDLCGLTILLAVIVFVVVVVVVVRSRIGVLECGGFIRMVDLLQAEGGSGLEPIVINHDASRWAAHLEAARRRQRQRTGFAVTASGKDEGNDDDEPVADDATLADWAVALDAAESRGHSTVAHLLRARLRSAAPIAPPPPSGGGVSGRASVGADGAKAARGSSPPPPPSPSTTAKVRRRAAVVALACTRGPRIIRVSRTDRHPHPPPTFEPPRTLLSSPPPPSNRLGRALLLGLKRRDGWWRLGGCQHARERGHRTVAALLLGEEPDDPADDDMWAGGKNGALLIRRVGGGGVLLASRIVLRSEWTRRRWR